MEITNDITINPDDIRNLPDNNITDPEVIRQIALYSCKTKDNSLNIKVKEGFEFMGLYPHVMKSFNIK